MNGYHPGYGYPPPPMDGSQYGSVPSSASTNGNVIPTGRSSGYSSSSMSYGYTPAPQEYTSSPDTRNGNQYSYAQPPEHVSSNNYSSYPQQAYSNNDPHNW